MRAITVRCSSMSACSASASWPIFDSTSAMSCRCLTSIRFSSSSSPCCSFSTSLCQSVSRWSTRGLRLHELLAEPRGRVSLALCDVAAPLFRDAPLLVGEL